MFAGTLNDTFETAMDLAEGAPRDVVGTGVDWWKVSSAHSGLIEVSMTAAEHLDDPNDHRDDIRNLNIEIYNAQGALVRSNFSTENTEPHRVCRRLQLMSRMEHHEQDNQQIYT